MSALSTRGLSKSFGSLVVARDIALDLPVGARYALIGPNGAGKTTLINLMTGMLAPNAGQIFLGEEDMPAGTSVRAGRKRRVVFFRYKAARRRLSGHGGLDFFFVDIEVRVNVLHIVVIFERLNHSQHLLRLRPGQLDVVLRHPGHLG